MEAMTHAIRSEFRYEARHEEGTQTAIQTIALGSGTCRDFAVLMMEAVRSSGSLRVSSPDISTTIPRGRPGAAAAPMPGAAYICPGPDRWNTIRRTASSPEQVIRVGVTTQAEQALPIWAALLVMRTIRSGCR